MAFTDFFGYLVGEQLLIGVRKHVYVYRYVSPVELTDGRGEEGGGRGAKSYDREKNLAIYTNVSHSIFADGGCLRSEYAN